MKRKKIALLGGKVGSIGIVRNTYGAQIQENVIRQKPITLHKGEWSFATKELDATNLQYILVELSDSDPGYTTGKYIAREINDFAFYTMYLGRVFLGFDTWLKLQVWEVGMTRPYLLYYPEKHEYSLRMNQFRQELPYLNNAVPAAVFEFKKIQHHHDEIQRKQNREKRRVEIRSRRPPIS